MTLISKVGVPYVDHMNNNTPKVGSFSLGSPHFLRRELGNEARTKPGIKTILVAKITGLIKSNVFKSSSVFFFWPCCHAISGQCWNIIKCHEDCSELNVNHYAGLASPTVGLLSLCYRYVTIHVCTYKERMTCTTYVYLFHTLVTQCIVVSSFLHPQLADFFKLYFKLVHNVSLTK